MSYYELIYLILVIIWSIFLGVIMYTEGDDIIDFFGGVFCGIGSGFILGVVILLVGLCFTDTINTANIEMVPKYTELTDTKLTVLGNDDAIYTFTEYKDIKAFQNDGKFYKEYYWKNMFGPDYQYMKVTIK